MAFCAGGGTTLAAAGGGTTLAAAGGGTTLAAGATKIRAFASLFKKIKFTNECCFPLDSYEIK